MINCYFDGKFYQYTDINVGLLSNSLNYGTSVIESIRFYRTSHGIVSINLDIYLDRFFNGIQEYGFCISENKEIIKKLFNYLIRLNKDINFPYFRVICFIGDESINTMSNDIHFGIILTNLDNAYFLDVNSVFSTFLRPKHNANTLKLACNYARNILEQRKAQRNGIDVVIFLGEKGEILECLSENIFYLKSGVLYTPESGNIVNGINRRMILGISKYLGIECSEKKIFQNDILDADEIFITGTATGIRNIISIGDTIIPSIGFTDKIKEIYGKILTEELKLGGINIEKLVN